MTTDLQKEIHARLLQTTSETEVQADLRALLFAMDAPNELASHIGDGEADIVLPQHRIVIETKRPGLANEPNLPQHRNNNESPFQQLERYVVALRSHFLNRFDLEDIGDRSWLGIVTDGRIWHVWRWPHRHGAAAEEVYSDFKTACARELVTWLDRLVTEGGRVGRPWPPVRLSEEFLPGLDGWQDLYANLTGQSAVHTQTKWELWRDMMFVSGMLPDNEQARNRLFVAHSYLVMIARGVVWTLTHREQDQPNPETIHGDGFAAWVLEQQAGRQMAGALLEHIHGWDWRARAGDILREVYAALIDPGDRRDFGEFYTPDWLAELVVQSVLDANWCEQSIRDVRTPQGLPNGIGVLDPACGSGTFLYHAAQHLLSRPEIRELTPVRQADVVASLVNGLDVHPVAVEIARATLLRALPAEPSAGISAIRIYIGDSLDTPQQTGGLFGGDRNGTLQVTSPRGTEMHIPRQWVEGEDFDDQLRLLVLAAREGRSLPPEITAGDAGDKELLSELHDCLTGIISREGNSVWSWYISNRSSVDRLRNRKINRIIANPPWVKLANIQVETRKRALEDLAKIEGENLWEGGNNAPHFDIAQLFIHRCRNSFMQDVKVDSAGWLVKRSALGASHWQKFRNLHSRRLENSIQTVDLDVLKPFGGGDARRCCLILENVRMQPADSDALKAIELPSGRKLDSFERLHRLGDLLRFEPASDSIEQGPSGYLDENGKPVFRQGATIVPHVLTLIDGKEETQSNDTFSVRTRRSQHAPWKVIESRTGEVPRTWLKPVLRSGQLLPFTTLRENEFIIPVDRNGRLHENPGLECGFWGELERIYREHRGKGQNTPGTLISNINYNQKLSSQLPSMPNRVPRLVLYPTSGDIMRATRSIPRIIDSSVYYKSFDKAEEAAFLVGLLNAPSLRMAFSECRSSGRHFHQYPWRRVPIPVFDPDNDLHQKVAGLTVEAENAAEDLIQEVLEGQVEGNKLPGQMDLSKRIRRRLDAEGIAARLDEVASRLLPNQIR
ncbi:MAG: N-6 DNA methylase [Rhodobacteraceae bacterium]|nr:N-6 DNA methylase [Paracoccaceae bacterium]